MDEEKIKLIIRHPESILKNHHIFKEEEWKQIYEYILTKRMDQELYSSWLKSQKENGEYKYKAIGQLFARFATLKRGFRTLDKSSYHERSSI